MKEITIGQIEKSVTGELLQGDRDECATGVSTDSREISRGDAFFAIVGEKYDGHDFIREAAQKGAKCAIVSKRDVRGADGMSIVRVADTAKALGDLAKWYLSGLNAKVIGITGSTGKTTTKDMLYHICREKFKTGRTIGNLNNHIGLPLSILSFDADIEVAVLEMGAECLGEVHYLADIAKPDIAVITNIGISHIETFGSRENILSGKMEITDFFDESSLLVVNEENDLLTKENVSGPYGLVTVGASGKSNYILECVEEFGDEGVEFILESRDMSHRFKIGVPGRHSAVNASLAIAAAANLGIGMEEAARGLQKVVLTDKRLNIKGKNGIKIIDDTYNASPDSVRAGIDVLVATKGMRKVAVLGDMLGLGENAKYYHGLIGEYAANRDIGLLILTGELSRHTAERAMGMMDEGKVMYYGDRRKLESEIKNIISPGDVILVKGSRAMAMESIVKRILE